MSLAIKRRLPAKLLPTDLVAKLTAQAEVHQMAAQEQWEQASEEKTRATIEHFKVLLDRAEKEREEARQSANAT